MILKTFTHLEYFVGLPKYDTHRQLLSYWLQADSTVSVECLTRGCLVKRVSLNTVKYCAGHLSSRVLHAAILKAVNEH